MYLRTSAPGRKLPVEMPERRCGERTLANSALALIVVTT